MEPVTIKGLTFGAGLPKICVPLTAPTLPKLIAEAENAAAHRDGQVSPLTAKELQLFRKLYENAGRIVTTGALCEAVCGPVWQGYESTLATHIRHLREKIEANPSRPVSIVTVKGLGYRLDLPSPKGAPR